MTNDPSTLSLNNDKGSAIALLPLAFFVAIFLGTGIALHMQGVAYAFYQLPAPVAIIPAIILALILDRTRQKQATNGLLVAPLETSLNSFIEGMGNNKVITMCLIYLLAGAFSSVAKITGGVDAVVALGLDLIPGQLVVAGLFVISAIIATAMGTSMGTIGAVAPIAVGVVSATDIDPAFLAGAVVGGAIFGDNLSFISDTTIAATKTQGAELKDKFKENLKFALPAAVICLVIYSFALDSQVTELPSQGDSNWILALPYFLIIVLAILGVNVFAVLLLGIVLSALSGALFAQYEIANLGKDIYAGFSAMQEIFLLGLLIGGLSQLMKVQGGLGFLVRKIESITQRFASETNKYANKFAIGGLAFITNLAVANNTVSIIVTGDTAKQLAEDADISPKQSASLLDIFSCIAQGIVPYGAQALLAAASFGISPVEVVANVWYCFILAFVTVVLLLLKKGEN